MSKKTKRLAKGLGASALAIATLASGLSFGATAATAATTPTKQLAPVDAPLADGGVRATWDPSQPSHSENYQPLIGTTPQSSESTHPWIAFENPRGHQQLAQPGWSPSGTRYLNQELALQKALKVSVPEPGRAQQMRFEGTNLCYSFAAYFGQTETCDPNSAHQRIYIDENGLIRSFGRMNEEGPRNPVFTAWNKASGSLNTYGATYPVGHGGGSLVFRGDAWFGDGYSVRLEGAVSFEASVDSRAVVSGKTVENGSVEVRRGSTVVGSGTADANGDYRIAVAAPNKAGDDKLTVALVEGGADKKTIEVTAAYGAGVAITDPANNADISGPYTVNGTAQAGSTVTLKMGSGAAESVTVSAQGQWSKQVMLPRGETKLVATQKSKGANTTTSTVTVNPGESSVPAPSAEVVFGADLTDRARVTGTAEVGATLTVRAGAVDGPVVGNPQVGADGRFSLSVNSPGAGERSFFVTQRIDNEVSEPTRAVGDFGAAVAVTALPAQSTPGDVTVAGTGETGANVSVKVGTQTKTVDVVDGRWSTDIELAPSNTAANVQVSQTAQGNTVTTGAASTTPNLPIAARAVTIDEPSSHEYTPMVETTLAGTATPYASVKIETTRGGQIRELKADKNGNWSFKRPYGPSSVYPFIATQTRVDGTTSQSGVFVMSPIGAFRPLTVTSHEDGGTYTPGENTFRGTATPDAMVRITNQWGRVIASAQASPVSGAWEAKGNLGPTADYTLTFSQTAPDGQKDMVTMDLSSDMQAYEDAALTSPSNNSTYKPGVTRFTGTGSEGTKIVAKNQWGTLMGQATVDADGRWAFDRNVGPSADYQITFTATHGSDGNTFTVNLNSPKFAALTLTSHAVGDTYEPLERVTFSGKASPFATITTYSRGETPLANATAVADANGDWSYTRSWGSPNGDSTTYPLRFVQTDVYGAEQDTLPFTWAPNPTE